MTTKFSTLFSLVAISALTFAAPANAITITAGNVPQPNQENVLLNSGTTGSIIQGSLNQSGALVNFSSTSGDLTSPSSGQARIEPAAGNSPFSNLTFWLVEGTFTNAVFNLPGISGLVNIAVSSTTDAGSPFVGAFVTGNGSNFFTVVGGGELLTSITVSTSNGSFGDMRQIRIGGYAPPTRVPDTGLSIILVGVGLLSLASFRRFFRR